MTVRRCQRMAIESLLKALGKDHDFPKPDDLFIGNKPMLASDFAFIVNNLSLAVLKKARTEEDFQFAKRRAKYVMALNERKENQ